MELFNPGHLGAVEGGETRKVLIVKAGSTDKPEGQFDEVVYLEKPSEGAEKAALEETTWE